MKLNQQEIEAFFLNHDEPWFEKIQEAETEEEAVWIATEQLDDGEREYDTETVSNAVRNIRSQ